LISFHGFSAIACLDVQNRQWTVLRFTEPDTNSFIWGIDFVGDNDLVIRTMNKGELGTSRVNFFKVSIR
jgi:hypothetical protein